MSSKVTRVVLTSSCCYVKIYICRHPRCSIQQWKHCTLGSEVSITCGIPYLIQDSAQFSELWGPCLWLRKDRLVWRHPSDPLCHSKNVGRSVQRTSLRLKWRRSTLCTVRATGGHTLKCTSGHSCGWFFGRLYARLYGCMEPYMTYGMRIRMWMWTRTKGDIA